MAQFQIPEQKPMSRICTTAACALVTLWMLQAPTFGQSASKRWALLEVHGLPTQSHWTARLEVNGDDLTGNTGCNSFSAKLAKRPDERVKIGSFSATRMSCNVAEDRLETAIFSALEQTEYVREADNLLRFEGLNRDTLLLWRQMSVQPDDKR